MEAPENTLEAFLHAHNVGAHIIETDVQITKDGVVIVCHDHEFYRLCKPQTIKNARVRDTHSSELPQFKEHMPLHFSTNGGHFKRADHQQNTYTTLEEVF